MNTITAVVRVHSGLDIKLDWKVPGELSESQERRANDLLMAACIYLQERVPEAFVAARAQFTQPAPAAGC